jgi:hypothetical protein
MPSSAFATFEVQDDPRQQNPTMFDRLRFSSQTVFIRQPSNIALWRFLREEDGQLHAAKFQETLTERNKYKNLTTTCDHQSIMMYDLFANAAKKAKEKDTSLIVEFTPGGREELSQLDVVGFKALYKLGQPQAAAT